MRVAAGPRKYWIEDNGESNIPLVFLHGFTGSSHTFDEVISSLPPSVRTITIDMPGHGETGELGITTMEQFSRDLSVLLNKLGLSKIDLVGYSMGGRAALSFAMLYPGYIDKLILESASPGLVSSEQQLARQAKDQAFINKLQSQGVEAFINDWEQVPLFHTQRKLSEEVQQRIRRERLSHTAVGLSQSLEGMGTGKQPSWWNQLPDLNKEVLLIVGQQDEKFVQLNQEMDKQLPQSTYSEVKGVGHAIHVEEPRIFAKIVEEFVV
ncbi:2-succinyl-6-hydroxy-2,4-cyclohexadiene-1-carboxylate synthase [Halobacillus seohaensis]|uniref:Putative 2-succinyl-6-hydroxy-2,4-cyclohexadiene-1-carboxylate synthase n=1 Tax=Halobacillus seohaensis TaxID=447421 RepID=A0ABW2ER79_9BACI